MTKKRGLLFAGVATAGFLALGSGVLAADLPPEPVATWTGFHIGIGGGYGSVLHDGFAEVVAEVDDEDEDLYNLLDFNDLGDEAGLGTIEAGFDWQANENFVLGIFGDFTLADFKAKAGDELCEDDGSDLECFGKRIHVKTDDIWTIGGRIGWLSSEQTLWYVLGGYSNAKLDVSGDVGAVDDEDFSSYKFLSDNDHVDGFTVGAGVESMLTDNVSLKLEYRYSDFGSFKKSGVCEADECETAEDVEPEIEVDSFNAKFDTTMQSIRAVLSWRFNWL